MSDKITKLKQKKRPKKQLVIEVEHMTYAILLRHAKAIQMQENLDYEPNPNYVAGWLLDRDYGLQPDEDEEEKGGVIY